MIERTTLFARYKWFINTRWRSGSTMYAADELNHYVGRYEDSTQWKRWNNNLYYSTRSYQTALKQLGCITMIKRGLWKINGPIPEWFSSLHLSALSNKYSMQALEATSHVWKYLPPAHKINPWKTLKQTKGITTNNTEEMKEVKSTQSQKKTKVTIIGSNEASTQLKPIEFTSYWAGGADIGRAAANAASDWNYIDLICRNYTFNEDLMFAYDDPNHRGNGVLYIGHFNDGVVC